MPNSPNYYELLQVSPDATPETIRKAYRQLSFTCHPDHNPGDPLAVEQTHLINQAYETLSDPTRRWEYHRRLYPKPADTPSIQREKDPATTSAQKTHQSGSGTVPRGSRRTETRSSATPPRHAATNSRVCRFCGRLNRRGGFSEGTYYSCSKRVQLKVPRCGACRRWHLLIQCILYSPFLLWWILVPLLLRESTTEQWSGFGLRIGLVLDIVACVIAGGILKSIDPMRIGRVS